ncbi:MAG TPA: hypothetical protein PK047_06985 [Saprospiraceae bacterium]|jgi:hypothetical protein|nr:hypothetical protein [Saprospiraceae bacterium]HRP41982.1 hypothetical protein [Saprospiraceae bacterium]
MKPIYIKSNIRISFSKDGVVSISNRALEILIHKNTQDPYYIHFLTDTTGTDGSKALYCYIDNRAINGIRLRYEKNRMIGNSKALVEQLSLLMDWPLSATKLASVAYNVDETTISRDGISDHIHQLI